MTFLKKGSKKRWGSSDKGDDLFGAAGVPKNPYLSTGNENPMLSKIALQASNDCRTGKKGSNYVGKIRLLDH